MCVCVCVWSFFKSRSKARYIKATCLLIIIQRNFFFNAHTHTQKWRNPSKLAETHTVSRVVLFFFFLFSFYPLPTHPIKRLLITDFPLVITKQERRRRKVRDAGYRPEGGGRWIFIFSIVYILYRQRVQRNENDFNYRIVPGRDYKRK